MMAIVSHKASTKNINCMFLLFIHSYV